jgi:hypothetical protein
VSDVAGLVEHDAAGEAFAPILKSWDHGATWEADPDAVEVTVSRDRIAPSQAVDEDAP